jgi:DNA polymerase
MPSPYQIHIEQWRNCVKCSLHKGRLNVVFGRGSIPCDVVLIGEAPGETENVLGIPFSGPSGMLLDSILADSIPNNISYAITNLVGCIPREDSGEKSTQPIPEEIEECSPKLQHFVKLANPSLIICVGALARDYTDPKMRVGIKFHKPIPRIEISHPARILRFTIAQRGLAIQRCKVIIRTAIEQYFPSKPGELYNG